MKKYLTIGVLLLFCVCFTSASTTISTCTVMNTDGETYLLDSNIINSNTESCLHINKSNIILDCQNHLIDGNDVADSGIYVTNFNGVDLTALTNITIKNCRLNDWDASSLFLFGVTDSDVHNITISSGEIAVGLGYVNDSIIYDIDMYNNTDSSVFKLAASNSNNITSLITNDEDYDGVYLDVDSNYNILSNINGFDEIEILGNSDYNTIKNIISDNTIKVTNSMNNNLINITIINSSTYGFNIGLNSNYTSVINSSIFSPEDTGIYSSSSFNNFTNVIVNGTYLGSVGGFFIKGDNIKIDQCISTYNVGDGFTISGSNIDITNNIANNNRRGFNIGLIRSNITIYNSIANNNSLSGFSISTITNLEIYDSTSNYNMFHGLYLFSIDGFTVDNHSSNYNTNGMEIVSYYNNYNTSSNIIRNSKITFNSGYGIKIQKTSEDIFNNLIFNNLFNNTNNYLVETSYTSNFFNTTKQSGDRIFTSGTNIGGNYWATPSKFGYSETCEDLNADYFCDAKLTLDTNSIDYLAYTEVELINPDIEIITPIGEYSTTEISYNISATDNDRLNFCTYWITRGASLEVGNTTLSCSDYITGLAYVSSQNTVYMFHSFVSDRFGNSNYTNQSFSTGLNATIVTAPGGGGGTTTIISGEQEWTMEVAKGINKYEIDMTENSIRTLDIQFENLGDSSITIKLSCEDVEGTACSYIKFPEQTFELALLKDTKQSINFIIDIPEDAKKGSYKFNIKAIDDSNKEGSISVLLGIGVLSIIPAFISKILFASSSFGIPYSLIFFPSLILGFIIFSKIFNKKIPLRAIWILLSSIITSITLIFLL